MWTSLPCHHRKQLTISLCIYGIRRLGLRSARGITFTEAFRRPPAEVHGYHHKFPMMNSKYVSFSNVRPRNPQSGNVPSSCIVLCG